MSAVSYPSISRGSVNVVSRLRGSLQIRDNGVDWRLALKYYPSLTWQKSLGDTTAPSSDTARRLYHSVVVGWSRSRLLLLRPRCRFATGVAVHS